MVFTDEMVWEDPDTAGVVQARGELNKRLIRDLMTVFKPDPFEGRPVLPHLSIKVPRATRAHVSGNEVLWR